MLEWKRRRPDSNWCTRLCRPLPNHSATAPRGPWYPGVSLGNPALERRRELQFVRPCPRALLMQVLDRADDVLHRGGLLRRCVLQPALRLLALDDRVDDEQRDVNALLA